MQIRCEKCTTLYNLDDNLIPAGGAPVQCTKCGSVFTAKKPEPIAAVATPVPLAPGAKPAAQSVRTGTLMFHAGDVAAAIAAKGPAPAAAAAPPAPAPAPVAAPAPPAARAPAAAPAPAAAARSSTSPAFGALPPTAAMPAAPAPAAPVRSATSPAFGAVPPTAAMPAASAPAPAARPATSPSFSSLPPTAALAAVAPSFFDNGPQPVSAAAAPLPVAAPIAQPHAAAPAAAFDAGRSTGGAAAGDEPPPAPSKLVAPAATYRRTATLTGTSAFEAEMQQKRKGVIFAIIGLVVVGLLVTVGYFGVKSYLANQHDSSAEGKLAEAVALVKSGDPEGARKAATLADEALAIEPGYRAATANKGLALLLVAAEIRDRADRVAARKPPLDRAFKRAEEAKDIAKQKELIPQLEAIKGEYDPLVAEFTKVKQDAEEIIEAAYKDGGQEDGGAIRALGFLRAASGDEKNSPILVKNYRNVAGEADGWPELIEGLLAASGRPSPEKRTKAIESLQAALAKDPSFGLAHQAIGKAKLELQDYAGARAAYEEALKVGGGNAYFKRLRADVDEVETEAKKPKTPPPEEPPAQAPKGGKAAKAPKGKGGR